MDDQTFWSHVDRRGPDDCWEWQLARDENGYGRCSRPKSRKVVLAHRRAKELALGRLLLDTECALHSCDNPPCCNPSHLFVGTKADNTADMLRKGRHRNQNRFKTHCVAGHQFDEENTHIRPNGNRECKACKRDRYNARYHSDPDFRAQRNARARKLYAADAIQTKGGK